MQDHFQNIQPQAPHKHKPLDAFSVPASSMNSYPYLLQVIPFRGAQMYYQVQHLYHMNLQNASLIAPPSLQHSVQIIQNANQRHQNRCREKIARARLRTAQKRAVTEKQARRAKNAGMMDSLREREYEIQVVERLQQYKKRIATLREREKASTK